MGAHASSRRRARSARRQSGAPPLRCHLRVLGALRRGISPGEGPRNRGLDARLGRGDPGWHCLLRLVRRLLHVLRHQPLRRGRVLRPCSDRRRGLPRRPSAEDPGTVSMGPIAERGIHAVTILLVLALAVAALKRWQKLKAHRARTLLVLETGKVSIVYFLSPAGGPCRSARKPVLRVFLDGGVRARC